LKSQYALYVIVFIVVLLSGCSSRHNPAPVSSLNTSVNDFQKGININGNKYTVQKGDTLYSIAFSAGKDFRTLAKNNSIPSPYIIYPGQIILLVKPGNTMAIANKKLKKNLEQPKQREYVQKQANKIVSNAKPSSSSKVKWFWPD